MECYAGEKDHVNQSGARNEKEKICLGMFSSSECKLVYWLQRTIGRDCKKNYREGQASKADCSVVTAQQLRAVIRQSARSDDRSAEAARELTTSGATELLPEALASRGASA